MQAQVIGDAVVLEIDIDASPERVFRALTDPQELSAWWNEGSDSGGQAWELDARVGGHWKTSGVSKSMGAWETWGQIVELDPPRVLAMTWHERLDKPRPFGETLVRYELEPSGSGTRIHFTHSGFAGYRDAFEDYSKGWHPVFSLLRKFIVTHA
jgi:uncharacterized protein YndB with AHSA1/START domain